jgi:hypothetical protein
VPGARRPDKRPSRPSRPRELRLALGGAVAYVFLARHPSLVERAVVDGAAIVPARVAPLMSAAVMLASPFLHRPLINRLMASALGVPPENRSAFRAGMRRVRPRTFSRAFHDAQNPGVLDEVLRCDVPTLLVAGEHELRDMHAANAALAALMPRADARIVPGVGHGWIATRPELHASVVRAWLEGSPYQGSCESRRSVPARLLPDSASSKPPLAQRDARGWMVATNPTKEFSHHGGELPCSRFATSEEWPYSCSAQHICG